MLEAAAQRTNIDVNDVIVEKSYTMEPSQNLSFLLRGSGHKTKWNLANTDTLGPKQCTPISEVSSLQWMIKCPDQQSALNIIQGCSLRGVPLYKGYITAQVGLGMHHSIALGLEILHNRAPCRAALQSFATWKASSPSQCVTFLTARHFG